jgi:hypothetical protein
MQFKRFAKPLSQIFRGTARSTPVSAEPVAVSDSAAVRTLEDGETLRGLAGLGAASSRRAAADLERPAQERVAQLVDAGVIDFAALCTPGANVDVLIAVAARSSDPDHLPRVLEMIDDPQRISELVLKGSSSRIRQLAAQSVSDPAELRRLLREVRGKDKSVYKIIKQKCDALRAEELRPVQLRNEAIAACESLERHSHRVHDVIYEPTFRHFLDRWQALEPAAAPAVVERAARAIGRCRQIMAEHVEELARQSALESEQAERQAAREQEVLLAALEAQRQSEAAARAVIEAAAQREAAEACRAEKAAAEALVLREIGGLIGKAHGALREGNTGRASGLRRAVEEKLSGMPSVPGHLAKQVSKLDEKLNELREWKEHAAAPKRAELIRDMESLVGSPEEPQVLADRIKQLQEDWKTVSKGVVIDTEADWVRFHQASVAAYQPCREYFESQAKLRAANAGKRRGVLDRLRAFETAQSGDDPDFKTMSAVLREAPQEWRRLSPVDRAVGRALQEEFDAAMRRIQTRLDAWHTQNASEKASLILQAQRLAAKEDARDGVEGVKRLQLMWKEVGPARRDQERALWEDFRAHCDAIFQRRDQAHAQYAAQLEANQARAALLCEEVEQAAAQAGAALLDSAAKISRWRSDFEAIGELPRAGARPLQARFRRALERMQTALEQSRRREKEQSIADLIEAARRIQAFGRAVSYGAEPSECEALKQAAENFIAGVQQWPKGGAAASRQSLLAAGSAAPVEAEAHETALRMLCIRSEILDDRATPPEDHALRRSYQMERLVKRLGQGEDAAPDDRVTLILEWMRVGPVPTRIYDGLLERFRALQ